MGRTLYHAHRYKHGKQSNIMNHEDVKQKVIDTKLLIPDEAFFWLLYYCGVRKSEAYERTAEDFTINDTHLIVDFHQRKKNGKTVDPLELPLNWYGIDKIVAAVEKAKARTRPTTKSVFTWDPEKKKQIKERKKAYWVFPKIQSTKAWDIVKKVLGVEFYPHFLRLNRLSIIGADPTASLLRLTSYSGIKSVKSLDAYLGKSKKEQQKAIDFMDKLYA